MKIVGISYLLLSAVCETVWNVFLAKSRGLTDWGVNALGIMFLICGIFAFKRSLGEMSLSIAAVVWSGVSLILTVLIDIYLFKTKIDLKTAALMAICLFSILGLSYISPSKTN